MNQGASWDTIRSSSDYNVKFKTNQEMAKKIYKISKFKCHPVTSLTTRKLGSDFDWLIVET